MSEEAVLEEGSAVLEHPFLKQMIVQLRAVDSYGTYDTWSDAKVLDPMILTKARRREIPVVGDPDETTISRVKAFYNGLAQMIEKETGIMAVPVINLTHEGFGRAMIVVGKLVALDKTLRDVHRFGFETPEKLIEDAEKLISKAVELVTQFKEVAKL
ncbi:NifX-associated nitrogen fixation protein [Teredinibacter turnerae]|uniref:Nitrogen fixation protein n=1 Tax=Teredinibacter turnerae (strain ATCC 39867 / T7901) TaxID=377629 RepID=C5BTF0_TERTT|nr:NifX-associated nitrogen fixation protein [Teredinibacter turnerae]ACR13426.1 putative nitrogen fixation protein [Teredinibacter turnerae T7901]